MIDTDPVPLLPLVRMKMLSKIRNASSVRNSSATRIAGFISGSMIWTNRCHPLAPSTLAAFSKSSGTRDSPASSSRVMNGVVFQISAKMMRPMACHWLVSGALPAGSKFARYPTPGVQANCQLNAAATVTIP